MHFTSAPSPDDSDDSADSVTDDENDKNEEFQSETSQCEDNGSSGASLIPSSLDGPNLESEDIPDNPLVLEMILVKDVNAGAEVSLVRLHLLSICFLFIIIIPKMTHCHLGFLLLPPS